MMSGLIGFVLLVSPCGHDACEYIPVTERIYPHLIACEQMRSRLLSVRQAAVLTCNEVRRESSGGNNDQHQS
ncbi:hypothetical protein OVA10_03555 [Lelliottia sp. SL45]|uniref:hypothetical protein n=1 Tax=Lelliottia sp. SL45 TaxID=2994665 RepID=UPI0022749CB2|nr:hypothetical protein [Lelliottia sp. SL45]MCY1697165.1 hypothetical protein [Lelliottia sp. SL45]